MNKVFRMNPYSSGVMQRLFRTRAEDVLPHVVSHQRVYILPSGRGWAFLCALLLMLVASINYALSLGYALCFLLTGLFAATLLHTYRNLAGLQISRIHSDEAFAGGSTTFHLSLASPDGRSRHGIRISTADDYGIHTAIGQDNQVQAELEVPAMARGVHRLGRLTLQSDWPLGLWSAWSYLHVPVEALVYPRPESHPPPVPHSGQDAYGRNMRAASQGDVAGLRSYVPGDSMGSIAWKTAARGQGLQVRMFESDEAPSQTVLSLSMTGRDQLEEQLSRLCAWILLAEQTHQDYALRLPGEQLDSGQGREQRSRALRALALHGTSHQ